MTKTIQISVCGCALTDHLYTDIQFDSPAMKPFLSVQDGDCGICPGKLVFAEDLEIFCQKTFQQIIQEISPSRKPKSSNLGGPAIVGAINAAQILYRQEGSFSYYGVRGNDDSGKFIENMVAQTPVDCTHYKVLPDMTTPCTDVLSDPTANQGKGERSFINCIGASAQMSPADLENGFFDADIHWYAATALVPQLHDNLTELLKKSKALGKINVVSTVFDFRNEKKDPVGPWPMGNNSAESYKNIDLLIVDCEEAYRLSGTKSIAQAAEFFRTQGVSSFFITYGAKNFYLWSDGRLFAASGSNEAVSFPVSALADQDLAEHPERKGDTTGCGDNFAGGIVSSLVNQLYHGKAKGSLSLTEAAAWGAASGGAALFQVGGTFLEKEPGEKFQILKRYVDAYLQSSEIRALNIP